MFRTAIMAGLLVTAHAFQPYQLSPSPDSKLVLFNMTGTDGYVEPMWHVEPLEFAHDSRVFQIHNFLTPEECAHLIKRAMPTLRRSTVVDSKGGGGGVVDPIRNSQGTFLNRRSDLVMSKINDRLALVTHIPVSNQEDMQILRYEPGQHYLPHTDWFHTAPEKSAANGNQRIATILIYLNEHGVDYTGGETIFPMLDESVAQQTWANVTSCTAGKLAVRPKRGDAVLFYSLNTFGQEQSSSTHGSCDVVTGIKFSAPIWMRQSPFHLFSLPPSGPPECKDKNTNCADWAEKGECNNNPEYMNGECARACKMCTPKPKAPSPA